MLDQSVRISHPQEAPIKSVTAKGQFEFSKGSFLKFEEESAQGGVCIIKMQFKELVSFNCISFEALEKEEEFLPDTFRFEISEDGIIWEPIIKEYEYTKFSRKQCRWNFSMIQATHAKLVTKFHRRTRDNKYRIALRNLKFLISGIERITSSSEIDRFWVKENIIDGRVDYGWSSKERTAPTEEFLIMDLGSINRVDEIRILSKQGEETNFPETFYFYYSEDDISWHQLYEELNFIAESGTWYKWKFFPTNIRFLKIICVNNKPNLQKKYVSQLVEVEIYAAPDFMSLSKKKFIAETPPYATVIRSGLVRLGSDGETNEGVAVQGNDKRLRDSTTEFKGIVELASDGEEREGVVVQGNDRRLKIASENAHGLTRLARNGEAKPGLVVQSNDDRLKLATSDNAGLVELAEDGETRPGVVVQGNDKRLKKATTSEYGLTIMSELGQDLPGRVVTADDPRIKSATTEKEGIMRFAHNGEESSNSAVQGNDKRLKYATTETPGIVELAQSGETKDGVAVQGSDKRLKYATTDEAGIMMFATHNAKVSNRAITADDPRLFDAREPTPHTHDFAPLVHEYDSHTGLIRLTGSTSSEFKNITPPMEGHGVIFGKNESKGGSGIVGVGADEGILGYGEDSGIVGYSKGQDDESSGVSGFSRNGYGGVFVSQKKYALFANGLGSKKKDIVGSGKGLLVKGDSDFFGNIKITNAFGLDCIAKFFPVLNNDIISKGDLVTISDKEGMISRSRIPYSTRVLGVAVESSSLEFGEKKNNNDILVAVYGFVKINVDASDGPILPGDLLVAGLTGGNAVKADPNKLKPGMIVAKSLGECRKDKASIQAVLVLS